MSDTDTRLNRQIPLVLQHTFRWVVWVDVDDDEPIEEAVQMWAEDPSELTPPAQSKAFDCWADIELAKQADVTYASGCVPVGPLMEDGCYSLDERKTRAAYRRLAAATSRPVVAGGAREATP